MLRREGGERRALRPLAFVIGLLALQGAVGALQWALELPAGIVWVHVVLATVTWMTMLWTVAAAGRLEPRRLRPPSSPAAGELADDVGDRQPGLLCGRGRRRRARARWRPPPREIRISSAGKMRSASAIATFGSGSPISPLPALALPAGRPALLDLDHGELEPLAGDDDRFVDVGVAAAGG